MELNQINIKSLDGLPAGEIHLAIAQSEARGVDRMEQKLAEHQKAIEHRLDNQDDKLATMQEDLTSLVGSDKVPGQVTRLTALVEGLVDKHDEWHEQDTKFRSNITQKVEKLSEQHVVLAKDVRQVRWFIAVCYALGRAGKATVTVVREGKDLYKVFLVGGLSWVAFVQFLHTVLPWLKTMKPHK